MPEYHLHLASGQTLTGFDERDIEDIAAAVDEPLDDYDFDVGREWTWIAGHYIKTGQVRAFTANPEET